MPRPLKSKFRPRNPNKYRGNPTNIICRSSWERVMCKWCDDNDSVLKWASEEVRIRYYDPVSKKNRTYFPDFWIRVRRSDGLIYEEIIEVKPQRQVDGPPIRPKRKTRSWYNEVATYATNQAKWISASQFCEDNGMNFRLLTEQNTKDFGRF